jgi:hypothetical protein
VIGNWEPFKHRVTVECRMWLRLGDGMLRKGPFEFKVEDTWSGASNETRD